MEADAERPAALRCRSCGAPIFFARTPAGKNMPMDAAPVRVLERGEYAVEWPSHPEAPPVALHQPAIYLTHFATCPNAAAHRKR